MIRRHMAAIGMAHLLIAVLLISIVTIVGCSSSSSSLRPSPVASNSHFLYVTGGIGGEQTQVFGYRIQKDGTLDPLALSSLIAPFCCHQVASAGTMLYVADFHAGIAAMSADPQSGQLIPLPGSPFPGLTASAGGSPTVCGNKFLYVTNGYPGGIFAFAIDSSGALSPVPGSPFPTGTSPGRPTVDPLCKFLFVTNNSDGSATPNGGIVYAYTVDASTGRLSPVSGSPFSVGDSTSILRSATADATGAFLYVLKLNPDFQTVSGFSIGPTGILSPLMGSPFTAGKNPAFALAVSVSSRQFLYVANDGSNDISASNNISAFAVDNNTGRLTLISNFASTSQPLFLASSGGFLYSFNNVSNNGSSPFNVNVYSINQDGTLIPVAMDGTLTYSPTSAAMVTVQ